MSVRKPLERRGGVVALIHVYIVVLEMFLSKTPRTRATSGTTAEFAEESAPSRRTRTCATAFSPPRSSGG
jgi:hypothetical protein